MRLMRFVAIVCVLTGCSSPTSSAPTSCDPSEVVGTYLVHWDDLSGNCGPLPDQELILTDISGAMGQAQCTTISSMRSANGCRVDAQLRCPVGSGTLTETGYIEETAADGSKLDGMLTYQTQDRFGTVGCVGTYHMSATRQ
jgi:hypothetical protein